MSTAPLPALSARNYTCLYMPETYLPVRYQLITIPYIVRIYLLMCLLTGWIIWLKLTITTDQLVYKLLY